MKVKRSTWKSLDTPIFLRKECTPVAPSGDIQKAGNELIMRLARKHGMPLLLTLDAHFVSEKQKLVQDLLLQNGKAEDSGLKFYSRYFQMSTGEAWSKWVDLHGTQFASHFEEGVENNHALAGMCERVELKKEYHLPEIEFPREIIEASSDHAGRCKRYIIDLVNAHGRMKDDPEYMERLKKEIKVIADNGKINLLPYFLALHDICQYAKQLGIWVGAGRGSAGGCLLAYLLKITHVDPIKYGLSFERFLSMGRINRGKLPDIDIDFNEPDKLAEFLKAKYSDKFARICTTGTNQVKGAIKDVCRVLLNTKDDKEAKAKVDAVCKTIGVIPQGFNDLIKWLHGWEDDEGAHQGEIDRNATLREFFEEHPTVQELVEQVVGIPKSLGRHASAYCLSDVPINEIVPVCRINEEDCTQFTMEPVESLGLVKFDLLGLNTLKDIGNCVRLIKERHGLDIDIYELPEDEKVFEEFANGNTETVFQFKGGIPTNVCKSVKPKNILDLAAITSACRPGTMYAKMVDEETEEETTLINLWIGRREGKKSVSFLHHDLVDILGSTHGIVLFQEQISAMFQKSCNYTAEQADEIREIIGKKKMDKMNEILPDIRDRLTKNGWNNQQINAFVSLCKSSSSYVFNLSHGVAYSYMAYICMWLKSHYPLEWWTAILQNSTHEDLEENAKYFTSIVECPDINVSDVDFYIIDDDKQKIVYPLTMIKGVKNAATEIFKSKPYTSFEDLFLRIDKRLVNKRVITALILSGAMDSMPEAGDGDKIEKRNALMAAYAKLRGEKEPETMSRGTVEMLESKSLCIGSPDMVEYFNSSGIECVNIPDAMTAQDGCWVSVAGLIKAVKRIQTKKGDDMCFIDIANKEYQMSVTCFPKLFALVKDELREDRAVVIRGTINVYNNRKSIIADKIKFFDIEKLD